MKAAILKSFGSQLAIEEIPAPVIGTGEVIVDVVATRVLSYADEVFNAAVTHAAANAGPFRMTVLTPNR